jgi:hypothetical protein
MEPVIELVRPKQEHVDPHLARLFGRGVPKRSYYRHIQTGHEFVDIAGAVAWPEKVQGFVLIVGVRKEDRPAPAFVCLDEYESRSPAELLEKAATLQEKWGNEKAPTLVQQFWWGDYERNHVAVNALNRRLEKEKRQRLNIAVPMSFERPNRFEVYLGEIWRMLKRREDGARRLYIGACDRLRNVMRNLGDEDAVRMKEDLFPAVSALGYAVHGLLTLQPWIVEVRAEKLTATMREELFMADAVATNEEVMRAIYGPEEDEWGDGEGVLMSTVKR